MSAPVEYVIADCLEFFDPFMQEMCHDSCLDHEGEQCWLWRGGEKAGKRPYVYLGCVDATGFDGTGLHLLGILASGPLSHAGLAGTPTPMPKVVYPFLVHDQLFHYHYTLIAPGSAIRPHQGAQSWASRSQNTTLTTRPFNFSLVEEKAYWDLSFLEWQNHWGRFEVAKVKAAWDAKCAGPVAQYTASKHQGAGKPVTPNK